MATTKKGYLNETETVRLDRKTIEAIRKMAKKNRRSLKAQAEMLIEESLS